MQVKYRRPSPQVIQQSVTNKQIQPQRDFYRPAEMAAETSGCVASVSDLKNGHSPSQHTLYQNSVYIAEKSEPSVHSVDRVLLSGTAPEEWAASPLVSRREEIKLIRRDRRRVRLSTVGMPHRSNSDSANQNSLLGHTVENRAYVSRSEIDLSSCRRSKRALEAKKKMESGAAEPLGSGNRYLTGLDALLHYLKYGEEENKIIDEKIKYDQILLKQQLLEKKNMLATGLTKARYLYRGSLSRIKSIFRPSLPTGSLDANAQEVHQEVIVRRQLDDLPVYVPWAVILISALQLLAIITEMLLGGVAKLSFSTKHTQTVQDTWSGNSRISFSHTPNIWIGPSEAKLIQMGAVFAPCIRSDKAINLRSARYRKQRLIEGIGCCEITGAGAGTTTRQECEELVRQANIISYQWRNRSCSSRPVTEYSRETHKYRPCCFSFTGQCMLTTNSHCLFIEGEWFGPQSYEHCSQLDSCSYKLCHYIREETTPYKIAGNSEQTPANLQFPQTPGQIWRFPLSLFLHNGVIHYAIAACLQGYLATELEQVVGWMRLCSIYLVSGVGGLLFGGILYPYKPVLGAFGAISGLVGLRYVELLQMWALIPGSPYLALGQNVLLTFVLVLLGFLPQMNYLTHIGGMILGALMAVICLPHVAVKYQKNTKSKRLLLKVLASVLMFGILTTLCATYFSIQPVSLDPANSPGCIAQVCS